MKKAEIGKITKLIREGKIIVCPTDTVYGLICDAKNKKAVKKLFELKRRNLKKPIPIFVKDIKMAKKFADINKNQKKFLQKVWPGKVTAVLKTKKKFPKGVVGSENKIGLRIPKYKLINTLIKKINRPLTATSANISGKPTSGKIKRILKQFENKRLKPDLFFDVGNLKYSKLSTVIDLTASKLKILRRGAIKKERLLKIFK